jgi:hypothetical protein
MKLLDKARSYIEERLAGNPCALPPHMRDYKGTGKVQPHQDWIGPLSWIPRSWNAAGPRCGQGRPGYECWPPILLEGVGVARWEGPRAESVVFIPELEKAHVRMGDVYGKAWLAQEMQPGRPDYLQWKTVTLQMEEVKVKDALLGGGGYITTFEPAGVYSPSALQKFSREGWMRLSPRYYSRWGMCDMKERRWLQANRPGGWEAKPEDFVLFFRKGHRPDHVDTYYNMGKGPGVATAGLHWE